MSLAITGKFSEPVHDGPEHLRREHASARRVISQGRLVIPDVLLPRRIFRTTHPSPLPFAGFAGIRPGASGSLAKAQISQWLESKSSLAFAAAPRSAAPAMNCGHGRHGRPSWTAGKGGDCKDAAPHHHDPDHGDLLDARGTSMVTREHSRLVAPALPCYQAPH
jgi:hypothetical protein